MRQAHPIPRRTLLHGLGALALSGVAAPGRAQGGGKAIRIVVPFAPGGSNDIVGRAVAQQLSTRMSRNVYVDNKPGAGGSIGAEMVARAEPDGSNLLLISSSFTMNASIMKLAYDPVKSFTPIAMLGMGPSVIAVPASLPVANIAELVAYSKANRGKVNFGSAGVASFQHFAIELFKLRTRADITVVHYKGGSPALADLAAGHVQMALGSLIQMIPFIQSGRIKLLAVAGPKRFALIPEVPTLAEAGIDVDASNWWALLAPAGTPGAIADTLHRETNAVLSAPDMTKRLSNEGATALPMEQAEFARFLAAESTKWAAVARETGIKPE